MKEPYVQMSVTFYLKNRPEDQYGPTQEGWTFGKKPVPFSMLLGGVVYQALDFYVKTIDIDVDEINSELQKLAGIISELEIRKGGGGEKA